MFSNDPKTLIGPSYLIVKQKELRKGNENKGVSNSLSGVYVNKKAIKYMGQEKRILVLFEVHSKSWKLSSKEKD